ncbi:hypothetical protein O7600_27875 [Micromonospora sp. WMMA1998]|uniref:hypothetical protein n=1 Tax=Micromonospora sp. WMMA1998 TaxID=3015167 RepID=UPI00248B3B2F|nr:hypothetical protein [Micromonospora sp. WMMA1998]WBC14853.1 hypothetical protein O7600_27875 [Micromonospora sp. WMMA1998]
MRGNRRPVELMFATLAVVVGFNIDFNAYVGNAADYLGLAPDSVGRKMLLGLSVPIAVVALTWLSIFLFHRLVWPFSPRSECRRGLWLYFLLARTDQGDLPVTGWFRIHHTPDEIKINEALAYYVDGSKLVFRGEWHSETVWTGNRRLSLIFTMIAQGVTREPLPSQYQGHIQLTSRSRGTNGERDLWTGYFHDLGDRRGIHGPVAAFRLPLWQMFQPPRRLLAKKVERLRISAYELVGEVVDFQRSRQDPEHARNDRARRQDVAW